MTFAVVVVYTINVIIGKSFVCLFVCINIKINYEWIKKKTNKNIVSVGNPEKKKEKWQGYGGKGGERVGGERKKIINRIIRINK